MKICLKAMVFKAQQEWGVFRMWGALWFSPNLLPMHPREVPSATCQLLPSSLALGLGEEAIFSPVFPPLLAVDAPPHHPFLRLQSEAQFFPRMRQSLKVSSWAGRGGGPCCEAGEALGRPTGGHLGLTSQICAAHAFREMLSADPQREPHPEKVRIPMQTVL